MNKGLHEGMNECWHNLKLKTFRPKSYKTQVLRVGVMRQEEKSQRTVEDTRILVEGTCTKAQGHAVMMDEIMAPAACQSQALVSLLILLLTSCLTLCRASVFASVKWG